MSVIVWLSVLWHDCVCESHECMLWYAYMCNVSHMSVGYGMPTCVM